MGYNNRRQHQESKAGLETDSPGLDSWRLEKHQLITTSKRQLKSIWSHFFFCARLLTEDLYRHDFLHWMWREWNVFCIDVNCCTITWRNAIMCRRVCIHFLGHAHRGHRMRATYASVILMFWTQKLYICHSYFLFQKINSTAAVWQSKCLFNPFYSGRL